MCALGSFSKGLTVLSYGVSVFGTLLERTLMYLVSTSLGWRHLFEERNFHCQLLAST